MFHRKCTVHPQFLHTVRAPRFFEWRHGARRRCASEGRSVLDLIAGGTYPWNFMSRCRLAGALLALCLCAARGASAQDEPTEFRVFLKDGTSLVSFGELARVEERVVFSMPTSASLTDPQLQLINLAAERVDWERTTRYAETVRSARYMATQAEAHYAMLTVEIAQAINDVQLTDEPAKRIEIVQRARRTLAEWPARHFNYKQAEIAHMVTLLDEAIAELRAAAGVRQFDLSFVASIDAPSAVREPLLPRPTVREAIEHTLLAARLADSSSERVSLMVVALAAIERDAEVLPSDWRTDVRRTTRAAIAMELEADRAYQSLTTQMLRLATERARSADVRGLERLVADIHERDQALGSKRPDAVTALLGSLEVELDAARRLRLARDRWALRVDDFRRYEASVTSPIQRLDGLKPALEDIKSLAGSGPWALGSIQRVSAQVLKAVAAIPPPEEFQSVHALLLSAAQMADSAAVIRREAALTGSMSRAWDASAAAAGALMLGARARAEIRELLRLPQLQR